MIRRITAAIVGVAAFVVLALGIPLAIVEQHSILSSELTKLQARSAAALVELSAPLTHDRLQVLAAETDFPTPFAIYSPAGLRIYGIGPKRADGPTRWAADHNRVATNTDDDLVVATPIVDEQETVLGVLRTSRTRDHANGQILARWAIMGAAGIAAIAAAWLLAWRLARRLSAPLELLAEQADDLMHGTGGDALPRSGIHEVDHLADALRDSAARVASALAKERQFSADVSHQLRTPIAGMRLRLESPHATAEADGLALSLLDDLARVETTVSHLLAFARESHATGTPTPVRGLVDDAVARWRAPAAARGRTLSGSDDTDEIVTASPASVEQILDVLIDNAMRHGVGVVTVATRALAGAVAIDVGDEGTLDPELAEERLFRRGDGSGHGIGLALARSLAQADGARLVLSRRDPTTFTLFMVTAPDA